MSESKTPARPSQVTLAGWAAVIGSALVVLTLFDSISQIRSIEMRESIQEFLTTSPGSGLGLDTAQVLEILRGLMLFAGAAAAAATVLAVYVLQRNNGARVGLTVAAVAIMATAPFTGSPFAVLVAAATMMLWTRPARDWFAGRTPAQAAAALEQRGTNVSTSEHPPTGQGPSAGPSGSTEWPRMSDQSSDRPQPPPTEGFGAPPPPSQSGAPASPQGQQPGPSYGQEPYGQPYGQQGQSGQQGQWPAPAYGQQQQYGSYPGYAQPQDPDKRPTTVTIAAWLTWVFSTLTMLAFVLVVVVMIVAREEFVDAMRNEPEFQQLDVGANDIIAAMWVVSAIVLIWCIASAALAVFAFRRQNWARITLVVSAAIAGLFSLVTFPVGLLHTMAAGATVALLFTGGANRWYSRKPGGYPSYQYPPYGPYGPPNQQSQYGDQQYSDQQYSDQQYGEQGRPGSGDKQDPPSNVW
jgi:hypothetical protein